MMERKTLFVILLIFGTAFWGISFPITKSAIGGFSQSSFHFYRFLAATIILSIIFYKQLRKINATIFLTSLGMAVPLVFGIQFQTLGIQHTSASQAAFIAGMCVVIIPILKVLIFRNTVTLKIWGAAFMALTGLFIISVKTGFMVGIGDIYTIIGAFGFAVYLINIEKYARLKDILPTIVPMFAACTLIMLVIALVDHSVDWTPQNNQFWLGIGFCALFPTAYMYTVSNLSQKYISAEKVAIIYLFEPIFAAVAAFFILNENLSWRLVVGGCLIFGATLIAELNFKKKRVDSL